MIAATRGAIDAPRSRSSGARRIRRTRTSSSVCASSRSTAHVDLGLEVREAVDERPSEARHARLADREHRPGLRPVAVDERAGGVRRRSPCRVASARRERVQLRRAAPRRRSAAPPSRSGGAAPHRARATASTASRAITRYVVYLPPLTRTRPSRLDADPVLARHLDRRRRVRRRDQRPQPGVRADDVVARQLDVHRPVHRPEELVDVLGARGRAGRRGAVVRLVGRADEPVAAATGRGTRPGPGSAASSRRAPGSARGGRRGGCRGDGRTLNAALAERPVRAARPRRPSRRARRSRAPRTSRPVTRSSSTRARDPVAVAERRRRTDPGHGDAASAPHGERRPQRPRARSRASSSIASW